MPHTAWSVHFWASDLYPGRAHHGRLERYICLYRASMSALLILTFSFARIPSRSTAVDALRASAAACRTAALQLLAACFCNLPSQQLVVLRKIRSSSRCSHLCHVTVKINIYFKPDGCPNGSGCPMGLGMGLTQDPWIGLWVYSFAHLLFGHGFHRALPGQNRPDCRLEWSVLEISWACMLGQLFHANQHRKIVCKFGKRWSRFGR